MRIRKKLWNNDAEPILVIMVVLMVLGTINVFSSSFVLGTTDYNDPYHFLTRHLGVMIGGIVLFFCFRHINYRRWQSLRGLMFWVILGTFLALVGVLIPSIGTEVNGARRWLFGVQPAELAKLIALMLASSTLVTRIKKGKANSWGNVINPQYGLILLMAVLIELEPDMGTAAIVLGVPVVMAVVAGMSPKYVMVVIGALAAVVVVAVNIQPYRMARLKVWFDPWADAQGMGYQTVQSLSTIGSGGFWGMGLGEGVSKYAYLPEAHTDFAFAIFSQEHGYMGNLLVFLLLALLVLFCVRIANRAPDEYGQILSMGIMVLIAGQAVANIMMVGGILPVVGVPLPFISYGGSSLMVTMMAMGMLMNVCDHGKDHKKDTSEEKKQPARPKLRLVK
ncbi:putative stage V sporulation protein E [Selenomonas ruminantium subsp. lactilytica TAM6421]|uniref:Probable peptidoglycan glycosyltransferase FtsW n=1 Tax=Selenomonas ruminantium subsp. lactilytica (strain NBRC 103574 / TAM6421) TaxID=927704 RepID=I0GN66_SELRL|nr:putative peptidoglycan glycosyltransferase FtsW [Selenomonas ruminantium]BAL82203.1 putative stage V sporulation protein E [Selenomonas ruminantium subsp. lactilytica TAM6421]